MFNKGFEKIADQKSYKRIKALRKYLMTGKTLKVKPPPTKMGKLKAGIKSVGGHFKKYRKDYLMGTGASGAIYGAHAAHKASKGKK